MSPFLLDQLSISLIACLGLSNRLSYNVYVCLSSFLLVLYADRVASPRAYKSLVSVPSTEFRKILS